MVDRRIVPNEYKKFIVDPIGYNGIWVIWMDSVGGMVISATNRGIFEISGLKIN
jgi:hypothetical protein